MLLMRGLDAFALGFQRRQILPGFAVAPRATFAKRRQYFKYVIIDYQGLIAAIRCALPQGPVRAASYILHEGREAGICCKCEACVPPGGPTRRVQRRCVRIQCC